MGNTNNGQELDIIVLGTPITKGSYAPYTKNGKAISDDARTTVWENKIRAEALQTLRINRLSPYDCPIAITGEIRMPRPDKTMHAFPAYQTAKSKGGGDLDKLLRTIGDALQDVQSRYLGKSKQGIISNDSRIIHWNISKLYATDTRPAGIYLTITPVETETDLHGDWMPQTPGAKEYLERLTRTTERINHAYTF